VRVSVTVRAERRIQLDDGSLTAPRVARGGVTQSVRYLPPKICPRTLAPFPKTTIWLRTNTTVTLYDYSLIAVVVGFHVTSSVAG